MHQDYRLSAAVPMCAIYTAPTGYGVGLQVHWHQGMELGLVVAGLLETHCMGSVRTLGPGEIYLLRSSEPHGWRELAPGTETIVVIFLPSWLGDERFGGVSWLSLYATRPLRRPSVTTEEIRAEVLAIGRDVNREIIERAPAWESAVRLQVLRVLLTLSRCCQASTRGEGESAVRPNDLARLAPALDLVHADPTRHPTLAEAASLCGWSRVHFCRIFGRVMGTSFGEFCLQARLGVAARLLVGSDAPLATVAEDSGFSSASHLNRSFRKHYRSSPGQYRVQWRSS